MVTSFILNSLGREVADSVEYVGDALELWTELEDRYDQTNGAKLYQTQKEINYLSQGEETEKQRELKPTNQIGSGTVPKGRLYCDYYKRPVHFKDKCYRLHGYPSGFPNNQRSTNYDANQKQHYNQNPYLRYNNKGKGMSVNSVGLSCDASGGQGDNSDSNFDDSGSNNLNLTKEQYGQVAHHLKQFQSSNTVEDQNDMQMTCGTVNFTGPFNEEASGDW
ncbi:hypothetical protein KY285_020528 [Solanum tuberosum]|nr:hypothetical protein KY285_020528 [Solanum tuberosum]